MSAVAVATVPLGALVALGGAYPSSVIPLLALAAIAFMLSGAYVGADRATRLLDISLVVALAVILLQTVSLPAGVVAALSPHALSLQTFLSLETFEGWRPLSVDRRLTRQGLASAASAMLLFWAARATFQKGGLRTAVRLIIWGGVIMAVVGLVQRVTSPKLLLWTWEPIDPATRPFGPFANRNNFASWLLMASSLAVGYVATHLMMRGVFRRRSLRLVVRDVLVDATGIALAAGAAVMTFALMSTASRGALIGAIAAVLTGIVMARRTAGPAATGAVVALILFLASALWLNVDALAGRVLPTANVGRQTIWRETLPVVRDFLWSGTGVGTYPRAMLRYQQTEPHILFNQAHNEYLQLIAEGGLLLTLPAIVAVASWAALAVRRLREDHDARRWIRVGAAAGIGGLAVHCIWESTLRLTANAMLLALLAAIVIHRRSDSTTPGRFQDAATLQAPEARRR